MNSVVCKFCTHGCESAIWNPRWNFTRLYLDFQLLGARFSKRLTACFSIVPNSDEEIEITYFPGSGPVEVQEDLMHLAFQVESMEEFQKHLESVGYQFSDGPTKSSSGSIFAFVDAPEGYEIEVIERPC